MKDIHEVLRRKQAQYAQLAKQIEALQAAADKLREVAPLLSEGDEEAPALDLAEAEDQDRMSAKAAASSSSVPASKPPVRSAPRWP
jgi:prefoldin subunit 5